MTSLAAAAFRADIAAFRSTGDAVRTSADALVDLERWLAGAAPSRILRTVIGEVFTGRIAVVSSFGVDSAVLLHQVAEIDRSTPVLFVDTGRHFPETLEHRDRLVRHLGLRDVRSVGPSPEEASRLDADLSRASWDPDGCCAFRKGCAARTGAGGLRRLDHRAQAVPGDDATWSVRVRGRWPAHQDQPAGILEPG